MVHILCCSVLLGDGTHIELQRVISGPWKHSSHGTRLSHGTHVSHGRITFMEAVYHINATKLNTNDVSLSEN